MDFEIRPLKLTDLPEANRVLQTAFQRTASFEPLIRLHWAVEPEGIWVAVDRGQLVGTISAIHYGRFGYIGLTSVLPSHQRRGIARRLFARALGYLERHDCPIALLDATDSGLKLYESMGFTIDATAYVYELEGPLEKQPPPEGVRPARFDDLPRIVAFDAPAFGAERHHVLEALWSEFHERFLVAEDAGGKLTGYLVARDPVLGPWVADDPQVAEALLLAGLALPRERLPQVMVPRSNQLCCDLLARHGFVERRRLAHMRLGGLKSPGQPQRLFGQTSFGHG